MDRVKNFFTQHDHFAHHVGIELLEVEPGKAHAKLTIAACHMNGAKTVHGGAIFTLADFVFAVAVNAHGKLSMGITTSTSFLRPATSGTLYATAREVALNNKLASYQVDVTDSAGDLIAQFQGTAYRKKDPLLP